MALSNKCAPVGYCIYCGTTAGKLGDEHIIPYSLNGALVLPKASCHDCAKITHRYEHTVAREIFGNFRMRHNVRTRRPKKRPTHITIGTLLPDGSRGKAKIPVAEHPAILFVYKFAEPLILRDLMPEVEKFEWLPVCICSNEELNCFIQKYHWDGITEVRTSPIELARMLAKIAYSFAVAELGLGSFRPLPMTLDTILERTNNVAYTVGGDWEIPPPDPRGNHLLGMAYHIKKSRALIIVYVRLFPAFETPQYKVVVGDCDFHNLQHLKTFLNKTKQS